MILMNKKQEQFVIKRAVEGKSFETIAKELKMSITDLLAWEIEFEDFIQRKKELEAENIIEQHRLNDLVRVKYLAELYTRLRLELDNRNFADVPTDRLCVLLADLRKEIDLEIGKVRKNEEEDEDDWDDYLPPDAEYFDE